MKPVILTGLRASNQMHIGNYFGALLPLVDMAKTRANEYNVHLFMPDLHSFTTPIDHSRLQQDIMSNMQIFIAAGLPLDNPNVYMYRQSYISAHSELAWILDCFTGFGELSRMAEFKDKSAKVGADRIGVGQFNYPPLMAADILLYDASYVPVGEDQRQHIEYTRNIAERMNNKFGELFVVPKSVSEQYAFFKKDQGLRIRDLQDPTRKMSKSDASDRGVIFLSDAPDDAAKKIMSAATDSHDEIRYDMTECPGISNLLQMLALLSGRDLKEVIAEYEGKTSYGDLKKDVAAAVSAFLIDFQAKLAKVDEATVLAKLQKDETAMREQANKVLLKVQKAVGLRA